MFSIKYSNKSAQYLSLRKMSRIWQIRRSVRAKTNPTQTSVCASRCPPRLTASATSLPVPDSTYSFLSSLTTNMYIYVAKRIRKISSKKVKRQTYFLRRKQRIMPPQLIAMIVTMANATNQMSPRRSSSQLMRM